MKRLCILVFAFALAPMIAYGDPQKPAATQKPTETKIREGARVRRDEQNKISLQSKVNRPSTKTHGVPGGGQVIK